MGNVELWGKKTSEVPEFYREKEAKQFDGVAPRPEVGIWRIAHPTSAIVADNEGNVGDFYDVKTRESYGTERHVVLFQKKLGRLKFSDGGGALLCRGNGVDPQTRQGGQGKIQLYSLGEMSDYDLDVWGLSPNQEAEGVLDYPCGSCPHCTFHKNTKGEQLRPTCSLVNEIFFLDLDKPDGIDKMPKKIDVRETNKMARESMKSLDNAIGEHLRSKGISDFAGVFKLTSVKHQNEKKQAFYVPTFEFAGYITDEEFANAVEKYYEEFLRAQGESDTQETQASDSVSSDKGDEEKSTPWG